MKKIFLFSFFILSSAAMTSCTADEMQTPTQNQVADDTGGQHGIPTPPPPPPPPAMGGGKNTIIFGFVFRTKNYLITSGNDT